MTEITPEQETQVRDYIKRMNGFASGAIKACPLCEGSVTGVTLYEKIEPETMSLYVEPCGCRLGLWGGAPDWVKADGLTITVVPSQWDFEGDDETDETED